MDYDAICSLGCGAGVQMLTERFPEKPVYPGLNTQFIGVLESQGGSRMRLATDLRPRLNARRTGQTRAHRGAAGLVDRLRRQTAKGSSRGPVHRRNGTERLKHWLASAPESTHRTPDLRILRRDHIEDQVEI